MRLLICCSRNWFKLSRDISGAHEVKLFSSQDQLSLKKIIEFKPDYIFFPHWNWVVDPQIHEQFECVVFHTAPLPYGRGGSPIQNLILQGFKESPVYAIKMTDKLDAGPIYTWRKLELTGPLSSIFLKLNKILNDLILDIIIEKPNPAPQVGEPHIFKRLTYEDNEIPMGLKLEEIYDRVRMVDHPDYPSAFIMFGDIKIELSGAVLNKESLEVTCVLKKSK